MDCSDDDLDAAAQELADTRWRESYDEAMANYLEFIRTRDFSTAGDLLPFFLKDFFHDSGLEDFRIDGDSKSVRFKCEALWIERHGESVQIAFDIAFENVVWLEVSLEEAGGDYGDFRYSEIDGLDERIAAADVKFGVPHHSITIETGWGGRISMVFGEVRVTATDPAYWFQLLRDPEVEIVGLFTGFDETDSAEVVSA